MARTLRVWLQGLAVAAAIFVIAEVHSLGVGLVTGQIKGYDGHTATDGLEWRLQAGSNKYHDNLNLPLDVPRTRELSSLASKGKTPSVDTEASTSGQKTGKKNKKSSDELSSSPTDSSSTQQELQTTGTPTAPRVETTMGKASSSQDAETEQSEPTVPATIATENIGSDVTLTGQGSRADKPPSGKSHTTGEMDEADNTKVTPTSLESLADTSEDKSHSKKTTGETNKTTTPPLNDQQSALPSTSTESDTAPSTDKIKKQATSLLPQKHSIQTSTSPSTSSAAGKDDSSPGTSDTSGNGNGNGNGKSNDKSVDNANENGREHGKKATSTSTPASLAAGKDDSSPGTSDTSGNGNGNGNGKSNDKSVDNANENGREHGKKATSTSTPASLAAGEDDSSPGTSATSGNGNGNGNGKSNDKSVDNANENGREHGKKATSTSTPASLAAGEDDSSPGTSGNGNGNGNGKSNDKSVDNANENGREHGKKATSTSTPASLAAGEDDSSPGTSATSGNGNGNGNGKSNDKSVDNANENGREHGKKATSTSTPASLAAGEDDSSPGTSGNGNGNGNGKSNDKSVDNANENGREHGKKATSTSTPASSAAGKDDSSPGTSATSGNGNGNGNGKSNDKSVDNANENGREHGKKATSTSTPASLAAGKDDSSPGTSDTSGNGNGNGNGKSNDKSVDNANENGREHGKKATSTSTPASSAAGEDDSSPGKSATSGNGNGNGNGKSNDKSVDNANENGREHGKKATSTSTPASLAAGKDDSSPGTSDTSGNGNGNGNGKSNDKSVDNANENGRENLSVDSNAVALNVLSDAADGHSKIEELGAASEVPKGLNAATMGNTLSNTDATSEDAAGTGVSNSHVTPSSSHDELTPANTVVPDTDHKVTPGELSTEPNTMDTASPFKSNDHASTAEKENRTSTSANTAADISPDPDTQITKDTTIETASTSTDAPSSTSKAQTLSGIPKKLSNKGNAEETPALSDAVLNDAAKSNAKSDDQHLRGSPTSDSATVLVRTAPATQANSASVSALSQTATKMTPNTKESSSNGGHGKTTRTDMMSIETMDAATQNAQQYVRGDPMFSGIDGESGSSVFTEGGDGSAPLVIGGRKRGWQVEAQSGLYAASSSFQNGLRFLVLNDGLNRHLPPQVTWNPNAWEFLLYTQYIQQIAVISALTLLKTPYFLWDFTDLFSWTNFLVYHAQDEPSSSGRRLTTIILGGLVGYGDRIGTNEVSLLKHASAGFGLVVGFFLGVVIGAILLKKWHGRHYKSEKIGILWRCLGLVLLVWFFSLLPLSMMTSFEVSMQFKAQVLELWPLTIAFAVIVLVFFGMILVAARAILHRSERYLSALRSRAIWGAFYSDCTYAGRLFFLLTVAQQICMGLCIGILDDSQLILVLLVTLHVVFVVAVLWARPFLNGSSQAKNATYAVSLLRLVNLALAFAFLPSSTLTVSSLYRVANAVIGLNSLVIVSWCIRHLFIFGRLVVASAKLEIEDRQTQQAETAMEASPSLLLSYELITKPQ